MVRVRAGQLLLLREKFVSGCAVGTPEAPAVLYRSVAVPRSANILDPFLVDFSIKTNTAVIFLVHIHTLRPANGKLEAGQF